MTCEQCVELLPAYLSGDVAPPEWEAIRAHLATGCPGCAGVLAEGQASFALMSLSLDPLAPPARTKDRLMAKVRASQPYVGTPLPASPSPFGAGEPERRGASRRWLGPVAVAACVALALLTGWQVLDRGRQQREVAALQRSVAERETRLAQLQSLVTTNQLTLIALGGSDPQPKASGRVFWDKDNGRWHAYFFDMKPPPPGKEYELWFITPDQKKVPAGTFGVDAGGKAELVVQVPADLGPVALAAVTDEPVGGSPQPTGAIQLAGKVQ